MVHRLSDKLIRKYARQFRSLAIVGPRQSGKTTLVKQVFPKKKYVSLEDPDERSLAENDPRAFLARIQDGAIIDEAQRVPSLFSYIQGMIDSSDKDGLFILTGSNNFLLQQSISQTLAGRIGYIDLLPLCYSEILEFGGRVRTSDELIISGSYPEVFDKKRQPEVWYPAYIRTYVERDVKQLRNIENTVLFHRFLQLCAGRTGQLLNVAALSNEAGIDVRTVNSWLSILESSYVVRLVHPHHRNFNKRVVKSPKLYFTDTGLACSLLGIRQPNELRNSHFRGALFESHVVMEIVKHLNAVGSPADVYFWRDNKGVEVDLILERGEQLLPIEIKSAQTFNEDHIVGLKTWNRYSGQTGGILIYDGESEMTTSTDKFRIMNWRNSNTVLKHL